MVESKPTIETGTNSLSVKANEMKPPLYIRDVTEERGWPIHVENLLKENLEFPVSINHISAALVFVMCVESGFVPENKNNPLPDAEKIYRTLDCDKIPRFSSMYPDSSRVPDCQSVLFRAIIDSNRTKPQGEKNSNTSLELGQLTIKNPVGKNTNSTQAETPTSSKTISNETSGTQQDKIGSLQQSKQSTTSESSEKLSRFKLSSPIKIVMLIMKDSIQINGMHQECPARNYRLSYNFMLQKYFKKSIMTENAGATIKKFATEWIRELSLDVPQMVQDFKSEFALPLMDSVGGFSNELRGVQSLPPEVLIQIFTLCPSSTVLCVGQTSRYLQRVTDDDALWRRLVWRDYKNSRQANDEVVRAAGKKPPDYSHDYRLAYKRLWLSSPERMNLRNLMDWDDSDSDDFDDIFGYDHRFRVDRDYFGFI